MQGTEPQAPEEEATVSQGPLRRWLAAHRRVLLILAVLTVALLGFETMRATLAEVRLRDVRHALHRIDDARLVLALGLTVASYFALTLYDWCAVGRSAASPRRRRLSSS